MKTLSPCFETEKLKCLSNHGKPSPKNNFWKKKKVQGKRRKTNNFFGEIPLERKKKEDSLGELDPFFLKKNLSMM